MAKLNELYQKELHVVNFGVEAFYQDLLSQNKKDTRSRVKPAAGGDPRLAAMLRKLHSGELGEKIAAANAEALTRILNAQPTLIGLGTAGELLPGMTKKTILHAGPPITWDRMSGPVRGAVMGGLIYEGLAKDLKEAEELAASGEITFDPCHHHNAVGPMAGVVTYSMPVWRMKNKAFGNEAYCTFNEGLGKVLRFGACDQEVIDRLNWLASGLYPVLRAAMERIGEIDIKTMIAQILQMGDEGHNRNKAGTSLLFRELTLGVLETDFSNQEKEAALRFLNNNDHTFLNISMPACKCTMDAIQGIPYSRWCPPCAATARTSVSGSRALGKSSGSLPRQRRWTGLYFPGYTEADANPDLGDSCITETTGIGGFCMAAAPAIVQFVGGKVQDAINYSLEMYEITTGEGSAYRIPALDFRGQRHGHRPAEGDRDRHPAHYQYGHCPQGLWRGPDRRRLGTAPGRLLHPGPGGLRKGLAGIAAL